jgi:hypothetical protein
VLNYLSASGLFFLREEDDFVGKKQFSHVY